MSRVGWSTSPSPSLVFRLVLGRTRREKGKSGTELLVANDIANVETVRFNLKTPFDRNIVTQGDYQVRKFSSELPDHCKPLGSRPFHDLCGRKCTL